MALTTAPQPSAPARWAVAAVLDYLNDEAAHHTEIAKHLRDIGDVDRQEQIIEAITTVRDLVTANLATA